jgi:hypothetical protein
MERSPRLVVWIAILAALILLAAYALLASLVTSMEILEFSTKIPWATMISTYIFLVAIGSGLCIINALGSVFGMQRYEMMTKRMAFLSLTTILFGMLCIVMHLGHPERMPIYNAISPNFRSAISWMGLLYSCTWVIRNGCPSTTPFRPISARPSPGWVCCIAFTWPWLLLSYGCSTAKSWPGVQKAAKAGQRKSCSF